MNDYYDYRIHIPDSKDYVGKGRRDRMYSHVKDVIKGRIPHGNVELFNGIRKALDSGHKITYTILKSNLSSWKAYVFENDYIKKHSSEICNIVGVK